MTTRNDDACAAGTAIVYAPQKMSLTALPDDCLLACLARVPYADLRNGLPCTCKSLRDAVASPAFRKTREAAGYVEWAVFARDARNTETAPYLIQASGAYHAAPGPTLARVSSNYGHWNLARLSSGRGDEIVLLQTDPTMRADAYNPLQNSWRELAPPFRSSEWFGEGIGKWSNCGTNCATLGSTIMVIGGDVEPSMAIDVYDASQDTWSRRPDFPLREPGEYFSKAVEVDGKLWLYALEMGGSGPADEEVNIQETFVYDPATQTWTAGPRLPHELWLGPGGGAHWHCMAFELRKRFCVMACFQLAPEHARYLAFIWDPIRGAWDEAPFPVPPVIALRGDSIDNNLIVHGVVDPTGPGGNSPRLFVLRPDSSDWDEWRIPDELDRATQIAAVRVG